MVKSLSQPRQSKVHKPMNEQSTLTNPVEATREKDLVLPALLVLAKASQSGYGPITTTELASLMESVSAMSEKDQKKNSDGVTRFRRTVQNLLSHNTMTDNGWVRRLAPSPQGSAMRLSITSKGKSELAMRLMKMVGKLPENMSHPVLEVDKRTGEADILKQSAFVIASLQADSGSPVSMTDFRKTLKRIIPKSTQDVAPLKNRSDTKIDQVIRNLVSNKTLEKKKLVLKTETGLALSRKGYRDLLPSLTGLFPTPQVLMVKKQKRAHAAKKPTAQAL